MKSEDVYGCCYLGDLSQLETSEILGVSERTFRRCVARCRGHHMVTQFSCFDQYLCMAFAQLTDRDSLRDAVVCRRAQSAKLYHLGIRAQVARNTLANVTA